MPGSPEDFEALCEVRGIDVMLNMPDTVSKLAKAGAR